MIFDRTSPILVITVAALVFLGIMWLGSAFGKECIEIGDCRACYRNYSLEYPLEYCTNNTSASGKCVDDPGIYRRNALVDIYLCLCQNKEKYQQEISDLARALGISGQVCSNATVPSKLRPRYVLKE